MTSSNTRRRRHKLRGVLQSEHDCYPDESSSKSHNRYLKELVDCKITCGGWGVETKRFFEESSDEIQTIGQKFEVINDPFLAANKVAMGLYAYYDNYDFLKFIRVKRKNSIVTIEPDTGNSTTKLQK